ncbi:CaiB/BaiF CoA-transferase family protein [Conexibacter sp. DBS9H8]|uniref:CaiB/BaiF CoA transferase family protein n=1 Tax=Conexibacter sp. DBS9H8 TaxID=2937801 RepID=UPI00200CBAE6|nr:CoA transferase [Conexibacter sp. DBS9H8]
MPDLTRDAEPAPTGPLRGLRVVEFAQIIAGPLAGTLMADLGAEVIHVEPPGVGDPHRNTGPTKDGEALWWKAAARNKRSVTLNLHEPKAQEIAHGLVAQADIVIVTMRSSTVQKWRLDFATLHAINPKLIFVQISGFGSTTSRADDPGFGKVGEARSGTVYITGYPEHPPVHAGFSQGDATTALMAAFAAMSALHQRDADPEFDGEHIDLALFESLFRLADWQVIYYDQLGRTPERSGNRLANAPAAVVNTYLTADDTWITITSATLRSVLNVVRMAGLDESDYQTWEAQRAGADEIDLALRQWVSARTAQECLDAMRAHSVTGDRIFSMADIVNDPIYAEREDIVTVDDAVLGPIRMQGVVPKLIRNPGNVWRSAPTLGQDNIDVFGRWLGMSVNECAELASHGVI